MSTKRKRYRHLGGSSSTASDQSTPCASGAAREPRSVSNTSTLAELARRDLLLQAVAEGSTRLLAADSLESALPQVLSHVAGLVRIDRVLVVQETPPDDGAASREVNCGWVGPNAAPLNMAKLWAAAGHAGYRDWLRPVFEGKVASATRT